MNNKQKVLYAKAVYGSNEINSVIDVLKNSPENLMCSEKVNLFESKIANIFGKRYGLMVNSGSSANTLAIAALNLEPGVEIITPALTFSTTVAPIIQQNYIPVFVDVEEDTYNIDSNLVEAMIRQETKAMIIPNLLGNLPDWNALKLIAKKYDLAIIEDSADTLGSLYNGEPTGKISDAVTTSFYGSHVITCAGFGGMVCFNDEKLERRSKLLRSWGRSSSLISESDGFNTRFNAKIDDIPYDRMFTFEMIGYNFLPSEIGAAFGLEQIKRLDNFIEKRIKHFQEITKFFKDYDHWFILPRQSENTFTAWLAVPLIVRDKAPFTRRDLQIHFEERGIQTRTVFTGNILRQSGFKNIPHRATPDGYPNSDQVMRGGILIGCHHGMEKKQISYIFEIFYNFVKKYI